MTRTVIINGRAYPAELAMFGLENELSGGAFPDAVRAHPKVNLPPEHEES